MTRAISTWDPFRDLGIATNDWMTRLADRRTFKDEWNPSCDVVESDKEFIVQAELPGVAEDDIEVTVDGNVLRIKGEKTVTAERDEDGAMHRERFYGHFMRTFPLSDMVKADKISANLKDGVLVVRMPREKAAEPMVKKVEISKG